MSHFNNVANSWDSEEKVLKIKHLADKIKSKVQIHKDLDILDFGCGTGLLGLEFLEHTKSLLGVDTSSAMLEVFDMKTKDFDNINSLNINLEESPLNKKFDLVISSMAFHHLQQPGNVLLKLSKMLNERGQILIVDLAKEDGSFHPNNEEMGVKHFGFPVDDLRAWADLSNLKVEVHIIDTIEKNNKKYDQFLAVFTKA